jgi:chaperonin cofactor prefoldin
VYIVAASEVNKLKLKVETLTAVVEDKDSKLKELQGAVSKFKRVSLI